MRMQACCEQPRAVSSLVAEDSIHHDQKHGECYAYKHIHLTTAAFPTNLPIDFLWVREGVLRY